MDSRRKLSLLGAVLCTVLISAVAAAFLMIYRAGVEQQRERLLDTVQLVGALLKTVAQLDAADSDARRLGLDRLVGAVQIARAHAERSGDGIEIDLARREGNRIVFLSRAPGFGDPTVPGVGNRGTMGLARGEAQPREPSARELDVSASGSVDFAAAAGTPVHMALMGENGSAVAIDIGGKRVVAAFEFVPQLGIAVVAKYDLTVLRAPFLRSALGALALACLLSAFGMLWFSHIGNQLLSYIQNSENRYRALFDYSGDGLLLLGDTFEECNDAACRLWRCRSEDIVGSTPVDFSPPFQPDGRRSEEAARERIELARRGRPQSFYWKHARKDGSLHDAWVDLRPLRLGERVLLMASVRDISEQLERQDAVERLSRAVEQSPVSVIITDTAGNIEYVNPCFEKVTGYRSAEVLGRNPRILKSGETPVEVYEELWRTIGSGGEWRGEFRNKKKSGELYWESALVSPVRSEAGVITHYLAVKEDITARKAAESENRRAHAAIREGRERLKAVFDNALEAIITIDEQGMIESFNPGAERIFGYRASELIGSDVSRLMPAKHGDVHQGYIARYLALGGRRAIGRQRELLARRRDGSTFPFELSVAEVPLGALGEESARIFVAVGRDISERKKAEFDIQRLNAELELRVKQRTAQLEEMVEEMEAFNYTVSHDLRGPLRGMDGFSEMLLDEYADVLDERGKDYLMRIRSGAHRMAALISDLLALSRLGRAELKHQQVDMSALARGVCDALALQHPGREVDVVISDGVHAIGDPVLLRVVLDNLLGNAWKFTRDSSAARVEFGVSGDDGDRLYFVRDNGAGFEPAYAEKIFGVFERLHSEGEFEGTGIGLATVQRIIKRHGGRVWGEGMPGEGAVFYFSLSEEASTSSQVEV